jgi:hypothetical protein
MYLVKVVLDVYERCEDAGVENHETRRSKVAAGRIGWLQELTKKRQEFRKYCMKCTKNGMNSGNTA